MRHLFCRKVSAYLGYTQCGLASTGRCGQELSTVALLGLGGVFLCIPGRVHSASSSPTKNNTVGGWRDGLVLESIVL